MKYRSRLNLIHPGVKMKKVCFVWMLLIFVLLSGCADQNASVHMSFTGDILLSRGVQKELDEQGYAYPYARISAYLKQDDLSLGNLECPITEYETPVHKDRSILFRANRDNAARLYKNGFNLLNLANNHSMDQGKKGMLDTLEALTEEQIEVVGAGPKKEEAQTLKTVMIKGKTIGFLGFSVFPPEGYIYASDQPDVSLYDPVQSPKLVAEAEKQCDYLIVSMHWGPEYSRYASTAQQEMAHTLVDSGADTIIGHHPHVLQGIEKYKGKMIFYSLGNFIFDKQIQSGTDETILLQLELSKQHESWFVIPLKIQNCQPRLADSEESKSIIESLVQRSNNSIRFTKDGNQWSIGVME